MSTHQQFGTSGRDFDDTTFASRSSFDFDDDMSNLGPNMDGFQNFNGGGLNFDLMNGMYDEDDNFEQELFGGRPGYGSNSGHGQHSRMSKSDQARLAQNQQFQGGGNAGLRPGARELQSMQSGIVGSRGNSVAEQFGQITPPNDDLDDMIKAKATQHSQSQQSRPAENGKLTNEQRARNAAITRHSKKTKKAGSGNSDDGEDGQKQSKNVTVQREKNRIAAAKCRAKKKTANEHQEELAHEYSATNNVLTKEIRELKNQKSELQNFLLAHRPGVCECHGIHDYNFGQAQRLVLNARRQAVEPIPSPSGDSVFSARSSASDASGGGRYHGQKPMSPQERMDMPSRHSSISASMNYGYQGGGQEPMQTEMATGRDVQHMSREFADFLQSSPSGRAGFS